MCSVNLCPLNDNRRSVNPYIFAFTFCLKPYTQRQKWKVIKFLTKEGAIAKVIHRHMADVYVDSTKKYATVAKRSREFKPGRDSLDDDSVDVISQEMIDRDERFVLNDAKLASECGISNGSVTL